MKTPVTKTGMRQYDHLNPVEAVIMAWTEQGINPDYHELAKKHVHDLMPLLGRALDRLEESCED